MPAPVASWTTVPVHGKWLKIDGTPHAGTVRFTISTRVTNTADDVIFPGGGIIDATLDTYGAIAVSLPAVDDPDNSPAGWSIKVEERLTAGGGATYTISPTVAMAGSGLDLRSVVVPAGSITTPGLNVLRGVAGGLAELDGDGDVVNAVGTKVGGSGTDLAAVTALVASSLLPDRFNDTTETVPAGSTTNCAAAGVTKTAPTPDASLTSPPKRFSIRSNTAAGDITISYPDSAGTTVTVALGRRSAITFRQKTNLGYGVESGNRSDLDLGNLYAPASVAATITAQAAAIAALQAGTGSGASVDYINGPLAAAAVAGPYLFDAQPPSPGASYGTATVTSSSDQAHTVAVGQSADGTTWTTTTLTAALSGGVYGIGQSIALTARYVRTTITNGSTASANTKTTVVYS